MTNNDVWIKYECLCPYCNNSMDLPMTLHIITEWTCVNCGKRPIIYWKPTICKRPVAKAS